MFNNIFLLTFVVVFSLACLYVVTELFIVRYGGSPVEAPNIPRNVLVAGKGEPFKFAVMGDSTAISQGSDYHYGIAVASTEFLAKQFEVKTLNVGVSGATSQDVVDDQLQKIVEYEPDMVLLSVGANDATKFNSKGTVRNAMEAIITELYAVNPEVKIIITGCPAVDAVDRFPPLAKYIMNIRTEQINTVMYDLTREYDLTLAPIAEKTRDQFLSNPGLTAADKFHPNADGYALWNAVVIEAIDEALMRD